MTSELFNRLKKIAQNEGRVVFVDGDDAFVLSALEEEYDDDFISDYNCEDDCLCDSFGTEEIAVKDKFESGTTEADKELIKKVNEDIAKWRAEQEKSPHSAEATRNKQEHESIKSPAVEQSSLRGAAQEQKEKTSEISNVNNSDSLNLEDEERYYLEPLE